MSKATQESGIEFVTELPEAEKSSRRGQLHDFADEVRKNPGRWARLERDTKAKASALASRITHDRVMALPASDFEATYRGTSTYVKFGGVQAESDDDGKF